jgi:tetratricopeptide (TPR) repeat protein
MKKIKYILLIFVLAFPIIGQNVNEGLKRQALIHMQNKKYGEAIDLLNKYLAANGQQAEAYNIRALCHQRRQVYPNALFDFRRAIRLEPGNEEYRRNEAKLKEEWYPILYDKIEGNKREIAINPNNAFNYLEIGKAYRWLEKWQLAENWYDEYLARDDDASPDEIIRFTIILQETGNITKGERILKKWVDRYPDDWRLWSRYGYFTMWLGNYSNAENAFENALSFKPFFKEAQDGLDLARREGYVTQYDEDYNYNEERRRQREYPIDRYYRIVTRNPNNSEARFELIELLLEEERDEEAYEQLKYLKNEYQGNERFDLLWTNIMAVREEKFGSRLDQLIIILKDNPTDRSALLEAAGYYAGLEKYDEAEELLSEYLELAPNDSEVILQKAKYYSWQERYTDATELLARVVELDPLNREAVDMLSSYYIDDFEYDLGD